MKSAVIVSAARTAIGSFGGSLAGINAVNLGRYVIEEALRRATITGTAVDEVILGNVLQAGLGQNPARQAAISAGLPESVPAYTVNKVCGSGLKAITLAAQAIQCGDAEVVVAGGTESMSQAPYLLKQARFGQRLGHSELIDVMLSDGLSCAMADCHMGITAENIVEQYGISRQEQDNFALESQRRAAAAQEAGRFNEEIVAVPLASRKGGPTEFRYDEYIRPTTTQEMLTKLKPAFKSDGTVTAGNASGINDGAAALVIMEEARARAENLVPLARIKAYAAGGVSPSVMGLGPLPAVRKALDKAAMQISDIELVELNEAFAAQSLAVLRDLKLDPARVNVNGGAIALGHPIGASGARVLVTLLYEMKRRNLHVGLAALCIGGGQGIAIIVER
ncbi:MAG: acetyl-CoA C-acetyltransferase [Acidobacteriota bacterium]